MQFIPPEIFTKFCTFLSPNDLFTLSQVCRKFRGYLYAPNSFSTQQIWKTSRLQFMPKEDMPPPEGMSEEKYVRLLITERGCQICKKTKECKIYWEFEVRCCEKCFLKKTSSIMPCVRVHKLHYWKEQIDFVYSQYCGLSRENLQTWLNDRKHMLDSLIKYVEQRESKETNFRHEFEEDHSIILNFFSSLPQPLPSDPPSYPLQFPPKKIVRRHNNEEINVDILFKEIDMPLPLPLSIQSARDISAQYIRFYFKSRKSNPFIKLLIPRRRKPFIIPLRRKPFIIPLRRKPFIEPLPLRNRPFSILHRIEQRYEREKMKIENFDSFAYLWSDYFIFCCLYEHEERCMSEDKREKKRERNGERRKRKDFIKNEKKDKNFKNKLSYKYG
ncbi:hypothetical protein C1646_810567 [Rhizophagus diaphanus]|nr:hypothetical protein C1646_810567 [Rhizophagus diaphanus] [Rhizophagus sp. MUCL 43196]